MAREYAELRNGCYYVEGSRVSLASIVFRFMDGASPETIREDFPALTLEQVYGAVAFFLGHEEEVEANLRETEKQWEGFRKTADPLPPTLIDRLERARQGRTTR
jgi:uncharacterized protein (DUF433 family)